MERIEELVGGGKAGKCSDGGEESGKGEEGMGGKGELVGMGIGLHRLYNLSLVVRRPSHMRSSH